MDTSKVNISSQSESEDEPPHQNLSELRKDVQLSPTKLRQITNTNEYIERVIELNNNAKESIDISRFGEALIYLSEAERILQHAANYGRLIDKSLIVHVLHNAACCYQKTYELNKCSGYLEALIYNYNVAMRSDLETNQETKPLLSIKNNEKINNGKKSMQVLSIENIQKKNQLAKYYLQYQVVNSQQQNHSGALIAGHKAVEILKINFKQIYLLSKKLKKSPYEKKFDTELKAKIIYNISKLNDSLSFQDQKFILNFALFTIRQWSQSISLKEKQHRNYVLEQEFRHYSIGNPLNLVPLLYQQSRQQRQKNFSAKNILQKLLTLGICYFTIATELRYISTQKYGQEYEAVRKNSSQFRESQLYHLLSIILISYFVPFQILLMKHITNSLETHYKMNLIEMSSRVSKNQLFNYGSEKESEKYEVFLFPQQNRINQSSYSITASAIGNNSSNNENQKGTQSHDNNNTPSEQKISMNSNEGTVKTVKKKHQNYQNTEYLQYDCGANDKQDLTIRTIKNNNTTSNKNQYSPYTHKVPLSPNSSKKIHLQVGNKKSKSKSKSKKIIMNNLIEVQPKIFHQQQKNKLQKSPKMKFPRMQIISPSNINRDLKDSRGLVSIKSTQKLKLNNEKNQPKKQQIPTIKDSQKNSKVNIQYFTSKSKDLRKSIQINSKTSQVVQSPRLQNPSKSSSKRESPVPNYFQSTNGNKSARKTIKSPRMTQQDNPYLTPKPKQKKKSKKMTFQEYYL